MNESELYSLIAEGEHERVDFKVELALEAARNKAEFIKDIISLANSAPQVGHLLLGVDKDGTVQGIASLQEERMQQIVDTYITPPIGLKCYLLPVSIPQMKSVGVIEISATGKPHKVARSLERLNQNDVYVRHGSVVVRASPEEIIRLHEDSQLPRQARQYIKAADKHVQLGNYENAFRAYSEAIDLAPTYSLFLTRGRLCLDRISSEKPEWKEEKSLMELALKDFTDAVKLSDSLESEKEARLARFRICAEKGLGFGHPAYNCEHDAEWLKANTTGREHGMVCYLEVEAVDAEIGMYGWEKEAIELLNEAIQCDYNEPRVYWLRALAHYNEHNLGLALKDIELAGDNLEGWVRKEFEDLKSQLLADIERIRGY